MKLQYKHKSRTSVDSTVVIWYGMISYILDIVELYMWHKYIWFFSCSAHLYSNGGRHLDSFWGSVFPHQTASQTIQSELRVFFVVVETEEKAAPSSFYFSQLNLDISTQLLLWI